MNPGKYVYCMAIAVLFLTCNRLFGIIRSIYLKNSRRPRVDLSKEIILGHAFWSYGLVVFFFGLGLSLLVNIVSKGRFTAPALFMVAFSFFVIWWGFFQFKKKRGDRVLIGPGNQISFYDSMNSVGLSVVYSSQIASYHYAMNRIVIVTNTGNSLKIPIIIKDAKLIVSFLDYSMKENAKTLSPKKGGGHK